MYEELMKRLHQRIALTSAVSPLWDDLCEAADAIEELSKQNEKWEEVVKTALDFIPCWIPVTERLPERRKWVLCRCQAGITDVLRYENAEWYHDPTHVYFFKFVTHRMPLPQLPKEER